MRIPFLKSFAALAIALGLSACVVVPVDGPYGDDVYGRAPEDVLQAWDGCDRQAELCFATCDRQPDAYGVSYCVDACRAETNQCFASVERNGVLRYGRRLDDLDFYGRSGAWSSRRGFVYGPHGRPYTIYRPTPGYQDPYRDPYYDDPNDCYGYRRAYWCDDRRYDDKPKPKPKPPVTPPPEPAKPKPKPAPTAERPERAAPVPKPAVPEPNRIAPAPSQPAPAVPQAPKAPAYTPPPSPPVAPPVKAAPAPAPTYAPPPAPTPAPPPPVATRPAPEARPPKAESAGAEEP